MNDTNSDADSISDSSDAHVDVDASGDEALLSSDLRELCKQLRANDPRVLNEDSIFELIRHTSGYTEAESIAIFQALKENTSVKHIDFNVLFEVYNTQGFALAAAEYVESSKTLQTLDLRCYFSLQERDSSHDRESLSAVLRALSRNTSVTKLIINTDVVRFVSGAFQELLTRTQTLQKWKLSTVIMAHGIKCRKKQLHQVSLTIRRCVI
jgi:hypothetical protein